MRSLPQGVKPDPDAVLDYIEFVEERHHIWENRWLGMPAPWTEDPVLASRKFTNVFRVLDHGTQFLLTELLGDEVPFEERAFRCILYRYTNRPEPWEYLRMLLGRYPLMKDADRVLPDNWRTYRETGKPIFSGAYRSGYVPPGTDRLTRVLADARSHFRAAALNVTSSSSQRESFEILKALPRGGPFMAMQIVTDLGYTPEVAGDENEFVVAGPGCANGLRIVFPDARPETFPWLIERAAEWVSPRLRLPGGKVRKPSFMDVQNTFCEFSKYVRPLKSTKPYTPAHPGRQPAPVYPSHWSQP